jgi:hypothetical protein
LAKALDAILQTFPESLIGRAKNEPLPVVKAALDDDGVVRMAPLRAVYILIDFTAENAKLLMADAREVRFVYQENEFCVRYAPQK